MVASSVEGGGGGLLAAVPEDDGDGLGGARDRPCGARPIQRGPVLGCHMVPRADVERTERSEGGGFRVVFASCKIHVIHKMRHGV